MRPDDSKFATVPVGKLGIIVHPSCAELGKRIDQYIVNWRKEREHEHKENVVFKDYEQDTYIIDATCSRFGTGEAEGTHLRFCSWRRSLYPCRCFLIIV